MESENNLFTTLIYIPLLLVPRHYSVWFTVKSQSRWNDIIKTVYPSTPQRNQNPISGDRVRKSKVGTLTRWSKPAHFIFFRGIDSKGTHGQKE